MSTYKRRIVYLSDEEWDQLTRAAQKQKLTISAVVRGLLAFPPKVYDEPPTSTAQGRRDELLGKINRPR